MFNLDLWKIIKSLFLWAGFKNRATNWVTAKSYEIGELVIAGDLQYRCLVAHTSGTFATDLTSNKWIADSTKLRKLNLLLESIFTEITNINALFGAYRDSNLFDLRYNNQVAYLERYLNDLYDPILQRIFITDTANKSIDYIYKTAEVSQTYITRAADISTWISTTSYTSGQTVSQTTVAGHVVYMAISPSINSNPSNLIDWVKIIYLRTSTEYGGGDNDYIVNIPNDIPLFKFDDWTTATAYVVGDLILDTTGGGAYICIVGHTSGGTFAGDLANWQAHEFLRVNDEEIVRGKIDLYNLAGITYNIITF